MGQIMECGAQRRFGFARCDSKPDPQRLFRRTPNCRVCLLTASRHLLHKKRDFLGSVTMRIGTRVGTVVVTVGLLLLSGCGLDIMVMTDPRSPDAGDPVEFTV